MEYFRLAMGYGARVFPEYEFGNLWRLVDEARDALESVLGPTDPNSIFSKAKDGKEVEQDDMIANEAVLTEALAHIMLIDAKLQSIDLIPAYHLEAILKDHLDARLKNSLEDILKDHCSQSTDQNEQRA